MSTNYDTGIVLKLRKKSNLQLNVVRISSATEKNQYLLQQRFCNKSQKKKEKHNLSNII
jgi:hypothetical protein